MHYIIDGYNVIGSADWLAQGSLRDRRERLLRFIEEKRPQGSASNRVTVVFDGRADVSSPAWPGSVQVVFSPGRDADRVIKDRVDEMPRPDGATVVTDDRAIQKWVRAAGARVIGCAVFLAAGRTAPAGRRPPCLTAEDAEEINEELKRIWKLK